MTPSTSPTPRPKESVWNYPRPPRLEPTPRRLRIVHAGIVLADTTAALRILETSHPPVFYLPPANIAMHLLRPSPRRGSFCEFKGVAQYWDLDLTPAQSHETNTGSSSNITGESLNAAEPPPTASAKAALHIAGIAWSYATPTRPYAALAGHLAFYPGRLDECTVDGERVTAQPGDFYGGWITSDLTGPFKGAPGTLGW